MIEDIKEAGKIDLAQRAPNRRHDNAVNQRGDDLAKGCADDYRYREVDDISAGNEFLEFFEHFGWSPFDGHSRTIFGAFISGFLSRVFVFKYYPICFGHFVRFVAVVWIVKLHARVADNNCRGGSFSR